MRILMQQSNGTYFDVTLPNSYSIENIQSIVFYARPNYLNYHKDYAFQLLNNDVLIYEFPVISEGKSSYRYDGPKINEVSTFSTGFSATQIIDVTPEAQLLVEDIPNSINIIPTLPNSYFIGSTTLNGFDAWNVKDGEFIIGTSTQGRHGWHSEQDSTAYPELLITLDKNYNYNDFQSIVIYSPQENSTLLPSEDRNKMMNGCVIQLLDENDNIYYTTPTINSVDDYNYIRIDGGDIMQILLMIMLKTQQQVL